jgi:predicted RNA-binding Zn-ribbon protein involved in translation (DUF1610 family)/transposase-like protein
MSTFTGQNIKDFLEAFPDDTSCPAYLAKIKWSEGFTCPKCGHTKGCQKAGHKYHCYNCNHVESATANTLFHKVKFGLRNAFCIVFEMSTSTKSLSSIQMGKRYGIRQGTAWNFMHKVRKAMESSKGHPLEGLVHVDEFVVGGAEEGKKGRSYSTKKQKAAVAVELTDGKKVKRVYVKAIGDYSAKSLTPIFEDHVSRSAKVVTDQWKGYLPLKREYDIEQVPSRKGKNFKELHIIVHQVKSWLRTVHSHIRHKHAQAYFDEFCFRINRSLFKVSIFHKAIERMVKASPVTQMDIKQRISV